MTRKELSTKSPLRVLLACFCFVVSAHSASAQVVAVDDTVHVGVNDAITIDALWNDSTQSGTLRIVGVDDLGASGTVTLKEDSTGILYSPSEDFSGTESFAYTATDGSSEA
ncbi:MAG: hypothetical protein KDD65_07630, partial [Bacteroidetes bacterium]|nr:hypothetical protein [Bacteroidota bacterium]